MIGYHTSHLNDKRKAARKTRSRPSISDSDMHGLCDISAQVSLCNVLINHHHHYLRSSASHPCGGGRQDSRHSHGGVAPCFVFAPIRSHAKLSLSLHHTATPQGRQTNKQTMETPGSLVFFFFFSLVADGKFSTPHSHPLPSPPQNSHMSKGAY